MWQTEVEWFCSWNQSDCFKITLIIKQNMNVIKLVNVSDKYVSDAHKRFMKLWSAEEIPDTDPVHQCSAGAFFSTIEGLLIIYST